MYSCEKTSFNPSFLFHFSNSHVLISKGVFFVLFLKSKQKTASLKWQHHVKKICEEISYRHLCELEMGFFKNEIPSLFFYINVGNNVKSSMQPKCISGERPNRVKMLLQYTLYIDLLYISNQIYTENAWIFF